MKSAYLRILPLLLCPLALSAQSLKDFEKRVTEFTLPNGLHFIIFERHEAPVVSFHSFVNAGSVDDPGGETGIAHMFEHMAFKGTQTIGTKNYPAERAAMDEVERIYDQYDAERNRGPHADQAKLADLQKTLKAAMDKANSFVVTNAYPQLIEENGGVGLNAGTGEDSTQYFYNFPRNRLELWFLLESQRFYDPVFREFYKERDVVREERRMRVESSPQGMLVEALLATAFEAHPYRNMPGGWASDIENFRLPEAIAFYKKYYVPSNITIAIAGDVDPKECRRLADKYFAILPGGPTPNGPRTVEPPQHGEKRVQVESPAQPFLAVGYKRPDQLDKDDPVFDVLSEILSGERTGLFYTELVRDKQIALAAGAEADFPGGKYPGLFILFLVPNQGHSVEENEKAAYDIIERVKREKLTDETLNRIKTKVRAALIRKLNSNSGMAEELTQNYVAYGDWRKLFTSIEDIEKVTADDVQRIARKYLVADNRTVAYTVRPPAKPGAKAEAEKGDGQ
ncbi:MAG TPA: pitrilysin family protein [Bryobacteraceae bacterium]|jgi:predicted Zn-dependent peptidase|nr:pitrilysin family protein [Bryobacteraceae bacterium]